MNEYQNWSIRSVLVSTGSVLVNRRYLGPSSVSWSINAILTLRQYLVPTEMHQSINRRIPWSIKRILLRSIDTSTFFIQQQSIMAHQESTKCISQLTEQYLRPSRVSCSNKRRESGSSRSILVDHTIQNILFHQKYLAPTASWSVHSTCSNRNALVNQQYQKSILVQQERSILLQQK